MQRLLVIFKLLVYFWRITELLNSVIPQVEERQRQPMQKQREHTHQQPPPPGRNRPITGGSLANVERTEENEVNEDEGGGQH